MREGRKKFSKKRNETDKEERYSKFVGSKFHQSRSKVSTKKETEPSEDNLVRLNKYIASCGVCSRREADRLIEEGSVRVNGKVIFELGTKIKRSDKVQVGSKTLKQEDFVYVLVNKPKDYITTTEDPEDRKTVAQLVKKSAKERIYPVGRLDRNTTGLLLFTNDGELADILMHPSYRISKVYQVGLDKPITQSHFEQIVDGLELEDGKAYVDDLALLSADKKELGIELHIGRNRIVRRIFEHFGYKVMKLDRVVYAGLTKKDLPRGNWRHLSEKEVINLKHLHSPKKK